MAKKLLQSLCLTAGSPEELQEFINVELAKGQKLHQIIMLDNKKGFSCCLIFEVDDITQTIKDKVEALEIGSGYINEPIFVAVMNDSERKIMAMLIEAEAEHFRKLAADPEEHIDDQDMYAGNWQFYKKLKQRFEDNPIDTNA